jgi:putative tricarboxylic transport membrane protein
VIAPEAANNAAAGGAMIPTLVLGIPGSPTTAIILAALVLQGLQPGPRLMHEQPLMLYGIFFSMLIASIVILFTGRVAVKAFAAVLRFPYHFIGPVIVVLSVIGSYAIANSAFGIWLMIVFGILGFFMKQYKYSPAALVLGMVLGRLMEENFRRQLLLNDGNYGSFFTRPIAVVIFLFALGTLLWPVINKKLQAKKSASTQ